jgi:hypothetical protein
LHSDPSFRDQQSIGNVNFAIRSDNFASNGRDQDTDTRGHRFSAEISLAAVALPAPAAFRTLSLDRWLSLWDITATRR